MIPPAPKKKKEKELYEAYLEGKTQRESGWRLLRLGGENKKGGDKEARRRGEC